MTKHSNNEFNFFDEEYFANQLSKPEKKINEGSRETLEKDIQVQEIISECENLNYIDNLVFNQQSNSLKNEAKGDVNHTTQKQVKIEDVLKDEDLNYFDELVFQSDIPSNEFDDKLIGTIEPKKTKEKKNNQQVPIVPSKNLKEETDLRKKLTISTEKAEKQKRILMPSNHAEFNKEIPNWYKMTHAEGATILKNNICYFNEEVGIIGIDKPYGLPSIGGPKINLSVTKLLPTLEKMLKLKYKLLNVHRLDADTTGVMLFAINTEIASKLREYFDQRKIFKQYVAITKFKPEKETGEINIPLIRRDINGVFKTYLSPNYNDRLSLLMDPPRSSNDQRKNAVTKYRVMDSTSEAALLEIQPLTGIQHQIRAHLSFGLGCPILGDHKYSHHSENLPQKLPPGMLESLGIRQSKVRNIPMHLHAYRIILPEFIKNQNVFIQAKLPFHFVYALKKLKMKF